MFAVPYHFIHVSSQNIYTKLYCACFKGGEGKIGKVIDIHGWGNESERSVAKVKWPSGFSNVYRCGHKGRIDLKYIQEGPGGYYYRDFLPILGKFSNTFLIGVIK